VTRRDADVARYRRPGPEELPAAARRRLGAARGPLLRPGAARRRRRRVLVRRARPAPDGLPAADRRAAGRAVALGSGCWSRATRCCASWTSARWPGAASRARPSRQTPERSLDGHRPSTTTDSEPVTAAAASRRPPGGTPPAPAAHRHRCRPGPAPRGPARRWPRLRRRPAVRGGRQDVHPVTGHHQRRRGRLRQPHRHGHLAARRDQRGSHQPDVGQRLPRRTGPASSRPTASAGSRSAPAGRRSTGRTCPARRQRPPPHRPAGRGHRQDARRGRCVGGQTDRPLATDAAARPAASRTRCRDAACCSARASPARPEAAHGSAGRRRPAAVSRAACRAT
jgi:hypothetical protein